MRNNEHPVLRAEDLDGHGKLFGWRIVERPDSPSPLVEIYIEDDENYFFKMDFDAFWVGDLRMLAELLFYDKRVQDGTAAVIRQIQMAHEALKDSK